MTDESKPPMRQIAELIDAIATERAESAERLLAMCEHQLTLAGDDIADRDAEIARLKEELAETRAELAGLQCALLVTPEQRGGYVTMIAASKPQIVKVNAPG